MMAKKIFARPVMEDRELREELIRIISKRYSRLSHPSEGESKRVVVDSDDEGFFEGAVATAGMFDDQGAAGASGIEFDLRYIQDQIDQGNDVEIWVSDD